MMSDYMDGFAALAGAYVHIPFCSSICPYCDFAVVAGKDHQIDRYCQVVVAEIEADQAWRPIEAIYFGGGTPSRAPAAKLKSILDAIDRRHGIADECEISLEANPEDFTLETALALRSADFNRVSFGAQSFDQNVLISLGRRHGPDHVGRAVGNAREAGFENVSLDLIYGTPGESDRSWAETVASAVESEPDHVSCYALTVEPGTPLGSDVAGGAPSPDPDVQADRFGVVDSALVAAGLARYEVSNWARPGRECAYNSIVWAQGEYAAYGNSAHRYRNGVRSRNARHLPTYMEKVEGGQTAVVGEEQISGWEAEIDRLFVGLRRTAGVVPGLGGAALLADDRGRRLVDLGVVATDGGRLRVAETMLTDEVLRVVVDLEPPSVPDHRADADIVVVAGE